MPVVPILISPLTVPIRLKIIESEIVEVSLMTKFVISIEAVVPLVKSSNLNPLLNTDPIIEHKFTVIPVFVPANEKRFPPLNVGEPQLRSTY